MKNEEIKAQCEKAYEEIRVAQEQLKELRSKCGHEKTFNGNYSWRPGSIVHSTICSYCGTVISSADL